MTSHHDPQRPPEQLAQERWLRSLMDELEREVHAPRRLRLQIEAARARRRPALAGLPVAMAGALATALLAVLLIPGGPAAPSLSQAAALATRGAAGAPPAPDPDDPGVKLSENVNDVYFPNWTSTLGWRPTGLRRDLLDLHRAVTVYYAYGTRRLAYTILSTPALAQPAAAVTVENGMTVRTLTLHGRLLVTWRRDGSTCILTGANVSAAQLRRLALTDPPPDDD
ncbi:MAG TPA: hypothetical protein VHW96_13855 [Solirubrobacteraceae bacterium]|jgi:hypothetical protein|nr:hypothetical protein [Solirubrobacteraceae bacterium]